MNRLIMALLGLLLLSSLGFAQSVMLEPMGVSPAQVKADTVGDPMYLGILDRTYNGLLNVGVETQMYLKGMGDMALVAPDWSVSSAPTGSAAAIGTIVDVDTSIQVAIFTPDVAGTYVVEFADGAEMASVTINAARFTGITIGACANCHSDKEAEWMETGHASMLTNALNGMGRSGTNCLPCHTTGFDAEAANGGFDDFPFEYPANVGPGVADSVAAEYPMAMALANIQCESCHGPGSAHYANVSDNKMVADLSTAVCAVCHDDDHYHVYPSQWRTAGHSNLPSYPGGTRDGCGGCHNGLQFIQFVEGETVTTQPPMDMECATCHDPHSDEHPNQLRTMSATLATDVMVMDAGKGALCMNCHQSRRDAVAYATGPKGHFGPHYAPQADMLIGTNAITFGKQLPTSPHLAATEDACVDCHMHEVEGHGEHDEEGDLTTAGMHSFSMVSLKGEDNVKACADCHGDVGESFDEKKYFVNGMADLDGDGMEEGLQEEVHGLMDTLGDLLPDSDPHADLDSTWTLTEVKAAFNHRLVYYDHSYGIHNPAWTVALLKVTIQALMNNAIEGEIVAIDDVPNDQGKAVRIIWDKFVDDGVSVDPVAQYVVKRHDMDKDVWVNVGDVPADGSMRYALVVPTLYDSTAADMSMTAFKVVALTEGGMTHESMPAEGYSVDNLVPAAPAGVAAKVVSDDVQVTWEESMDEDFNYFAIYRSTEAGFVPSEENLVATMTSTEFVDADLELENTYYYKVSAFDFSGNESDYSDEVSALLTGVDSEGASVPTDFVLNQNFPNPFNPSTTIEFGVPNAEVVTINIYDIRGVHVRTLATGRFASGYHTVTWNGMDAYGNMVSAGTYLYRLESNSQSFTKKMIYLK